MVRRYEQGEQPPLFIGSVGRRQSRYGVEVAREHAGRWPDRDMRSRKFRSRGHRRTRSRRHVCRARHGQAEGVLPNEWHQRGPGGLPDGPDRDGHVPVDRDVIANINYAVVPFIIAQLFNLYLFQLVTIPSCNCENIKRNKASKKTILHADIKK